MIAKLKGIIDSVMGDSVIIDVGGVGYFVYVTARFLSTTQVGDSVEVLVHHIFKQDQQYLCGFQNSYELALFKNLLDVPGIGVKSALSILSMLSPEELAIAIASQDAAALFKVSGIGAKTASRILLELKGKTILEIKNLNRTVGGTSGNVNDAILGLISLGYQRNHVIKAVQKVIRDCGDSAPVNDIIVLSLRELQ